MSAPDGRHWSDHHAYDENRSSPHRRRRVGKDPALDASTDPDIPPLARRPQNVSVALVAHFERLIATGELAAGTRLPPERELATTMSVSRSSLREAMHELESKHLISRIQGRGTIVLAPTAGVQELLAMSAGGTEQEHAAELRSIIEPSVAGLAAHRATAANLLQLQDVLEKSHENLLAAESVRLDREFHLLLAQAAQNPLLVALQTMAGEWTSEVRQHSHATKEGRRISVRGHRAIFGAVQAHDGMAARQAMEDHLRDVRELIARATRS
jgi:GntR family transcriptional repressor for pyruvate dehydrogenase complex